VRILYLSQYFDPEVGATQNRSGAMVRHLVDAGHQVTVVTECPNHPRGVMHPAYRRTLYAREDWHGADLVRVWVWTSPSKTFLRRMAFYLSYMIAACVAGIVVARGRYDVIVATSPPLFAGTVGRWLSRLRRTPLVFEVRDPWPEAAVALGQLRGWVARRPAYAEEARCLARARAVVTVSEGSRAYLSSRGVSPGKVHVIRNGSDPTRFRFKPRSRARVRRRLGVADAFLVVYAGLMGLANDCDVLLDAAGLLRADTRFRFLLIGDGPRRREFVARAESMALPNTTFLHARPAVSIAAYLSAADAVVIPLDARALPGTCTCKMYDAMACGRPIVLCANGTEGGDILRDADAGVVVPSGDAVSLTTTLPELAADPARCERYGQNGRRAVTEFYDRRKQAAAMEDVLRSVCEAGGAAC
jgi:glycosyltransferase involved in cell wall biosynthesis